MLKRGTWLLLLSAIALTGGVLFLENQTGENRTGENQPGENRTGDRTSSRDNAATVPLFPFKEDEIEQFTVIRSVTEDSELAEAELSFVKGDDGNWKMSVPEAAIAQNGAIAFLLSQVTTVNAQPIDLAAAAAGEDEDDTDASENPLAPFGLDNPVATVLLTVDERKYRLAVGGSDFVGDQRYVQAIEEVEEIAEESPDAESSTGSSTENIYLISGSIITAIERPVEDWLLLEDEPSEETLSQEDSEEEDSEDAAEENAPAGSSPADELPEGVVPEGELPADTTTDEPADG